MPNNQVGGLWPFTKTANTGYGSTNTSYGSYGSSLYGAIPQAGISSGVLQYLFYFIILVIVILLLLVIINFTLFPIFKVRPGGKGIIPIPGSNDEQLYWNDINKIATIPDTFLGNQVENWSMMLDIQVDNPNVNTQFPRVLFTRGPVPATEPTTYTENDTILEMNPSFNVIMYLDRLVNDLYISVQTISTDGNSTVMLESAVIPNIPVGKSIRLGLMVGSHSFEVYINGYLAKTKTFTGSISTATSKFQPPNTTIRASTARVMNLRVWKRTLSAGEFRAYKSSSDFPLITVPDSCLANPDIPSDLTGAVNSLTSSVGSFMNNLETTATSLITPTS